MFLYLNFYIWEDEIQNILVIVTQNIEFLFRYDKVDLDMNILISTGIIGNSLPLFEAEEESSYIVCSLKVTILILIPCFWFDNAFLVTVVKNKYTQDTKPYSCN